MWFNDRQLAAMRAQVLKLMPDTCIIQAVTLTADGYGGVTETWAAVTGGTVECRLDPTPTITQIVEAGQKEGFAEQYYLTLPYDAPIEAGNRISVEGVIYQVRRLDPAKSAAVTRRAILGRTE